MQGSVLTPSQPVQRKKVRGFTLTEIAIVLGIIGLILGGVWVAATEVRDASRCNQAVQDISTMAANMRSTFSATNAFSLSGKQTPNMITAGVIPNDLLGTTAGSTKNAWNGAVDIYLNNTNFTIQYSNIPVTVCNQIASQVANIGTGDAPTDLLINGTDTAIPNNGTAATGCPAGQTTGLCTAAVSAACAAGGAGMTLAFQYNIH